MLLKNQNLLFFTRTMRLGGTENVVLQLCEIFKQNVNKIVVCSCGGVNVETIEKMGIKHYLIPDIENKNPKVILSVVRILEHIVKEENITVIHTHHRMAAFYVSLLKLYKKSYFINTSHNTFNSRIRLTFLVYQNANLIACGEMVKKNLVDIFGIEDKKVTVIHNAVKPFEGTVSIDKKLDGYKKQGKFLVGNVGRLSKQKGMEYFIEAIPMIIKVIPNVMFFIVGEGEEEEKLKKLAISNHIEEYLDFLGYRNDIQNVMSQFDIIVLSSLWEGLPLTPIEAFSVGKTVVATAVDGTVEIVRDGIDGYLVEPKNSVAISEKVIDLYFDETKKRKFEKAALERYKSEFSFDSLKEKYLNYYMELK